MANNAHAADAAPALTVGKGIAVTLAIVVVVAGFVALGFALGLVPLYAGFLLLWYWATVDKLDFKAAPATIVGALAGVATAWGLQIATEAQSAVGLALVLGVIVLALFASVMNYVPFLVNPAYMLFLTIACAPLIQGNENFVEVVAAILAGTVYFGAILFVGTRLFAGGAKTVEAADEAIAT